MRQSSRSDLWWSACSGPLPSQLSSTWQQLSNLDITASGLTHDPAAGTNSRGENLPEWLAFNRQEHTLQLLPCWLGIAFLFDIKFFLLRNLPHALNVLLMKPGLFLGTMG